MTHIATLERALDLQNKQEDRQRRIALEDRKWAEKKAYNEAFALAQGEIPQVAKNCTNDHTKSEYENLEAILLAISPVLSKHGFGVEFRNGLNPIDKEHYHGIATVVHKDGHEKEFEDQVPLAGKGTSGNRSMTATQGHGGTKTYARRYMLKDIWNIAVMGKDSDGNTNNISDLAQEILDQIADCPDDLSEIQKISEDISSAGNKLSPVDMPRVRRAWANKKKGIEDRLSN